MREKEREAWLKTALAPGLDAPTLVRLLQALGDPELLLHADYAAVSRAAGDAAARAEPITAFDEELRRLAADMAETMYAAPGVGLAANQVGVLRRIVVVDVTEDKSGLMTLINPEVVEASEELRDCEEGCLSLKGLYEHVKRPDRVRVRAQNLDGETFEFEATGLLATCVQHEIDHLEGVVFIDHLSRLKKDRAAQKLRKLRLNDKKKAEEEAKR